MSIKSKKNDYQEKQFNWSSLFSIIIQFEWMSIVLSLVLILIYLLSRIGYPINVKGVLLSFSVLCISVTLPRLLQSILNKLPSSFSMFVYPFFVLSIPLCLGLISLLINDGFTHFLQYVILIFATVCFVSLCWSIRHHFRKKGFYVFVLLTVVLGWYLGVKVWGVEYLSPLLLEKILMVRGHQDTLFHLALSNIFSHTGTVSTGLDGTPFIPYHAGSHIWLAELGKLLSLHVIDVYALTYPIVIFPLLFFTLSVSALLSSSLIKKNRNNQPNERSVLYWGVVLIVFIVGLMPLTVQTQASLSRIIFFSESYTIALTFFFSSLPLIFILLRTFFSKRTTLLGILYVLPIALLWCFLLGYIKISHLYFVPAVAGYLFIRLKGFHVVSSSIFICSTVVFLFLFLTLRIPDHQPSFSLFHQFLTHVDNAWKGWWLMLGFGWLFFAIHLDVFAHRAESGSLLELLNRRRLLMSEVLIVITIVGIFPGMFFNLPGANANYFLEIPRWIALLCIGIYIFSGTVDQFAQQLMVHKFSSMYAVSLFFVLFFPLFINVMLQTQQWYFYHLELRNQFLNHYGSIQIDDASKHTEDAVVFQHLLDLSQSYEQGTLLYIDRADDFWKLAYACDVLPLVVAAVSGYPQLYGLPAQHCSLDLFAHRLYSVRAQQHTALLCPTHDWKKVKVFNTNEVQNCTY